MVSAATTSKLSSPAANFDTRKGERSDKSVGSNHMVFAGPSPAVEVREGGEDLVMGGAWKRVSVIVTGVADTVTVVGTSFVTVITLVG